MIFLFRVTKTTTQCYNSNLTRLYKRDSILDRTNPRFDMEFYSYFLTATQKSSGEFGIFISLNILHLKVPIKLFKLHLSESNGTRYVILMRICRRPRMNWNKRSQHRAAKITESFFVPFVLSRGVGSCNDSRLEARSSWMSFWKRKSTWWNEWKHKHEIWKSADASIIMHVQMICSKWLMFKVKVRKVIIKQFYCLWWRETMTKRRLNWSYSTSLCATV